MTSYREAGVDVAGADKHVDAITDAVKATWVGKVTGEFGGFAAGVEIPEGYDNPVLMMSTDGVGTKLELARRSGKWGGIGHDLVAMCVDDLAATGATAIGFVDYLAVGALDPDRDRAIVSSVAEACTAVGCPLLGGETAEHPGVMAPDAIDLAGAAMGVVSKGAELGTHLVEEGDVVIGLSSPNLRSNGFSLVRRAMGEAVADHMDELVQPSVIYTPAVMRSIETGAVHAGAHITGGGMAANLQRVIPEGLGATVDTGAWERPAVFNLVKSHGVPEDEMFKTFNMGIGFCLITDRAGASEVLATVAKHSPVVIGTVSRGEGVTLR